MVKTPRTLRLAGFGSEGEAFLLSLF